MLATTSATAETGLRIGVLLPLTGELATFAVPVQNAVSLAVDEINQAGGVFGGKLALVVADDRNSPKVGAQAARKMIATEEIAAIIGPIGSDVFAAVAREAGSAAGVPIITGSGMAPTMADQKGFAFRTTPDAEMQGAALADVAAGKGYRSVSIIHSDDDYGKRLSDAFRSRFARSSGTVPATLPYSAGQADYDAVFHRTGHAEALALLATPGDGATILKQALESGSFNKFIVSDGMKTADVADAVGGQFLDGVSGATPSAPAGSAGAKAFSKAYATKVGEDPRTPYGEGFYDAVYLIALAAEQAKTTESTKFRDAIRAVTRDGGIPVGPGEFAKAKRAIAQGKSLTYVGASGPIALDGHGHAPVSFAEWRFHDGKVETVRIIRLTF